MQLVGNILAALWGTDLCYIILVFPLTHKHEGSETTTATLYAALDPAF